MILTVHRWWICPALYALVDPLLEQTDYFRNAIHETPNAVPPQARFRAGPLKFTGGFPILKLSSASRHDGGQLAEAVANL
jgi:hypothetical protein